MAVEKKRGGSPIETFKTVLLTLLIISMLVLIVVYIGGTHIYQSMTEKGDKKVFDKLWSVQSGQRSEGLDRERLLPELIGYKFSGSGPMCSIADRESASELYELISPCLSELFGSGSYCEEIGASEGERLFADALESGEFIYLRYHVPVLYQLVYAFASGKTSLSESDAASFASDGGSGAYLSEVVIIPESGVAAHRFEAYAKDGDGRYFRFRRDESAVASEFHISKLSDIASKISTRAFGFSDGARLEPMQLTVPEELECDDIDFASSAIPDGRSADVLRLFGYNPDKLKGYEDDGAGVYYDSHSRIRLETGKIAYQAVDAVSGIGLSSLLGYSADDGFGLFDKLAAADCLLTELSEISDRLVGGEAELCLGNVYTENSLLIFEYFYTYENIRISGEPAVRAAFGQDTLCAFELLSYSFEPTGSTTLCTSQEYVLEKLFDTGVLTEGQRVGSMRLVYEDGGAKWKAMLTEDAPVK